MLILNEEWAYIHIPRTSGVNFKTAVCKSYKKPYKIFWETLNQDSYQPPKIHELFWGKYNQNILTNLNVNVDIRNMMPDNPRTSPLFMWEEAEIYSDEKVFTICRNPYTRLVSLYYNSLKYYKNLSLVNEDITLEQFLFHPLFTKLSSLYGYTIPTRTQVEYLKNRDGQLVCDRFYKMETNQKSLQRDFRLEHINDVKYNSQEYDKDYAKIYNDRTIEFVQTTFKQDFDYFEYDINPFW
jgi:hypothetical protein